mmetsp:Transcript_80111/g.111269  ORF Transcript_80111/g.111269 Transcript_80111/m.111269 type:complete len:98 (-) Transcript_80111:563-856(-)
MALGTTTTTTLLRDTVVLLTAVQVITAREDPVTITIHSRVQTQFRSLVKCISESTMLNEESQRLCNFHMIAASSIQTPQNEATVLVIDSRVRSMVVN